MTLVRKHERDVVSPVAALLDCNPFLPERVELGRRARGDVFVPSAAPRHENTIRLAPVVEQLGTTRQPRSEPHGLTAQNDYSSVSDR